MIFCKSDMEISLQYHFCFSMKCVILDEICVQHLIAL